MTFGGAGIRIVAGTYNLTGSTNISGSGGTNTFSSADVTSLGTSLSVSGSTNNFDTGNDFSLTILQLSGVTSVIQGSDNFIVTGSMSWSGATMGGTGTLTTNASVTTTMSGTKDAILDRSWDNNGIINWTSGTSDFTINSNLNNIGTFNLSRTNTSAEITGTGTFNNSGTVATGSGTDQQVDIVFNNTGQVNVVTGNLTVNNTGADTGSYAVSSGRTLTFTSSGTRTFDGVSFTGLGTAVFSTGTFTMSNSLTFEDIDITLTQAIGGTGTLNLQASAGNSIGIGASICGGTCTNTFTTTELGLLSATDLVIGGAGDAYIETIVIGDFATISGNISMLTTAGNITFNTDSMAFFNDTAKLTTLSAAAGTITVPGTAAGDIGIGNATCSGSCAFSITGAKLQTITASSLVVGDATTGNLYIDGVTATDVANIANVTLNATNAGRMVAFMGSASTFQGLTLNSDAGITLNLNLTTTGVTTIDADSDNDGTGDFTVNDNITLNTSGNILDITAFDLVLNTSGKLNAGLTTIRQSNGMTIGVGAASGMMTVSTSDLGNITAGILSIGDSTAGAVTVNGVTTSTAMVFESGSTVAFDTGVSTFNGTLAVVAVGNITQTAAINVVGGANFASTTGDVLMSNGANDLGAILTIDTNNSFNVSTISTLTDLGLTVNAINTSTYTLTANNLTLAMSDTAANLTLAGITQTGSNLNFSLASDTGNLIVAGNPSIGTGSFNLLSSTGNISQTTTITHSGTSSFTVAGSGTIDLTTNGSGNDFTGAVSITAGNGLVLITDMNAFVLGTSVATGDIAIVAGGDVTQAGPVAAVGLAVTTTSGAVTLNNVLNDIINLAISATGNVDYTDSNDFAVGSVNGLMGVTTSGGSVNLSTTANLTVNNDVMITGGTGTLALTADSDKDGAGTLTIGSTVSVVSNNNTMTLQGADISTNTATAINAGTGAAIYNYTASTNGTNNDLTLLTASSLTVNVTGDLTVDGLMATDFVGVGSGTGLVTLYASNDVIFSTTASDHLGAMVVEADRHIDMQVNVTTGGNFTAEADHDKNGVGDFTLATARTLSSSSGNVDITAVAITNNGIITAPSGTVTLTETGTTTTPEITPEVQEAVDQAEQAGLPNAFVKNALGDSGC